MTIIDNIIALADEYAEAYAEAYSDSGLKNRYALADKAKSNLRTELTEALAGKQAQEPIPSIRKTMHTWEKNVLGKLNPSHFGIPQEYCEAAQSYAEFFHSNKLDSVRVSAHALQDLVEIFGGDK